MKIRYFVYLAMIPLLSGGFYIMNGGLMFWNPKYDQKNLAGLTSAQVVQKLGPPSYDPRKPIGGKVSWTSEREDGPLVLGYYDNWATCVIKFKNDTAISAARSWK